MLKALLICAGVLGALLDILLHVLQLHDLPWFRSLQDHTAAITLLSAGLIGLSLLVQFNAGTLVMIVFIAFLAITSMKNNKKDQLPEAAIYADETEGASISKAPYAAANIFNPPADLSFGP